MTAGSALRVIEVVSGVHLCRARDVNWVLLVDGDDVTLVDSGYPGDGPAVDASLERIGRRPQDLRALLLTHAHVDHLGGARRLHEAHGVPLLVDPVEVAHARRETLEQAGTADVLRQLWRPGVLPWALRIAGAGARDDVAAAWAAPFPTPAGTPLDLPGAPVPVPTGGHTAGHVAFLLPGPGVAITGDELITGHALSRRVGPQRVPGLFESGDPARAAAGLQALAGLPADVILPGHGDVWHEPLARAVDRARPT